MFNFRGFIEEQIRFSIAKNAGQNLLRPESPVLHANVVKDQGHGTKHSKTVDISNSYKPMIPVPLKGMTAQDFGSKIKRVPKPKI